MTLKTKKTQRTSESVCTWKALNVEREDREVHDVEGEEDREGELPVHAFTLSPYLLCVILFSYEIMNLIHYFI